jgi:hypothetical protein
MATGLHNSNTTAGAFSPLLVFSKTETGSSAFNASIAAIGARTVTGTGAGDSWIDGDLMFYTAPTAGTGLVERMRITQDGNIGIGTTSPSFRLDVSGSSKFAGNMVITGSLSLSGSSPLLQLGSTTFVGDFTNPAIIIGSTSNGFYLDSNRINFKAGGSFAGGFSSDGILGNQILIRSTGPNDLTTAMYIPYRLNAIGLLGGLGGNDTGAVTLITSGSARLYISSSGYVGIGTTAPTYSLDIAGTGGNDGVIRSRRIIATGGTAGDPPITTNSTIAGLFEPAYGNLGFSAYGGEAGRIETISRYWNIGMTGGTAKFNIRGSGSSSATNALVVQNSTPSTLFVIQDGGNVGINNTNPGAKLDVIGNGGTGDAAIKSWYGNYAILGEVSTVANRNGAWNTLYVFETGSSATNAVFVGGNKPIIFNAGNVGIGTTLPLYKLDVNGTGRFTDTLIISSSSSNGALVIQQNSVGFAAQFVNRPDITNAIGQIAFSDLKTGAGNRAFGIGIGRSGDPQWINGDFIFAYYSGSGTWQQSAKIFNTSGNWIIGTSSLDEGFKLDVNGTARVNGTTTITGSLTVITGSNIEFQVLQNGVKIGNAGNDISTLTGSLNISSSNVAANLRGSGSAVFSIDGTSGRLFQVDDSLTGSLFSVNTAAGLPIIEAFSDNTVRIGQFGRRALFVSQSSVGIGKETLLNGILDVSGSVNITGSLNVSGSITGSLFGTASWAQNAITASYVLNGSVSASYALSSSYAMSASIAFNAVTTSQALNANTASFATTAVTASSANDFLVRGTLTAQTIVAQVITSSTDFVTGSTRFGSFITNTHQFTGSVSISGSPVPLTVNNNILYVSASGNVGINTTSPAYRLEVNGTARIVNALKLFNGATGPANNYPLNAYVSSGGIASFEYGTDGFIQFVRAGAAAAIIRSSFAETYDLVINSGNAGTFLGICLRPDGAGVKIGGDPTTITHVNSAQLNIESTTKGFLPTRTNLVSNISNPAQGLITYLTGSTNEGLWYYSSGSIKAWTRLLNDTGSQVITGSLTATSFTGSLFGTASWANNVISASYSTFAASASYALTASHALNGGGGSGGPTSGAAYTHTQASPSSTWTVPHNLNNLYPVVTVYDFSGNVVIPQNVSSSNANQTIITFSYGATGYATAVGAGIVSFTTASLATSASYAATASVLLGSITSASYSATASVVLGSITSASYSATASVVLGSVTSASYAQTSSYSRNFTVGSTFVFDETLTDYASVPSSIVGSNNLFTQATGSYTSAFIKYTAASASNARAGEVIAVWNGGTTQFTDFSTVDVGTTTAVTASATIVTNNLQFNIQTNTLGWNIKSIITYI